MLPKQSSYIQAQPVVVRKIFSKCHATFISDEAPTLPDGRDGVAIVDNDSFAWRWNSAGGRSSKHYCLDGQMIQIYGEKLIHWTGSGTLSSWSSWTFCLCRPTEHPEQSISERQTSMIDCNALWRYIFSEILGIGCVQYHTPPDLLWTSEANQVSEFYGKSHDPLGKTRIEAFLCLGNLQSRSPATSGNYDACSAFSQLDVYSLLSKKSYFWLIKSSFCFFWFSFACYFFLVVSLPWLADLAHVRFAKCGLGGPMMSRTDNGSTSIHVLTIDKPYGRMFFVLTVTSNVLINSILPTVSSSKACRGEGDMRLIIGSISLSCCFSSRWPC